MTYFANRYFLKTKYTAYLYKMEQIFDFPFNDTLQMIFTQLSTNRNEF